VVGIGICYAFIIKQWKEELMYCLGMINAIPNGSNDPDAWMGVLVLSVLCLTAVILMKIATSGGGNNNPPGGGLPPGYIVPRK